MYRQAEVYDGSPYVCVRDQMKPLVTVVCATAERVEPVTCNVGSADRQAS